MMPHISQSLETYYNFEVAKGLTGIFLSFQIQLKDKMKNLENLKI